MLTYLVAGAVAAHVSGSLGNCVKEQTGKILTKYTKFNTVFDDALAWRVTEGNYQGS